MKYKVCTVYNSTWNRDAILPVETAKFGVAEAAFQQSPFFTNIEYYLLKLGNRESFEIITIWRSMYSNYYSKYGQIRTWQLESLFEKMSICPKKQRRGNHVLERRRVKLTLFTTLQWHLRVGNFQLYLEPKLSLSVNSVPKDCLYKCAKDTYWKFESTKPQQIPKYSTFRFCTFWRITYIQLSSAPPCSLLNIFVNCIRTFKNCIRTFNRNCTYCTSLALRYRSERQA